MKKLVMCLVVLMIMVSGCTFTPPRKGLETIMDADLVTEDEVLTWYDANITGREELGGKRFKPMEGYKDTPVVHMKDIGALTINEFSPLWMIAQLSFFIYSPGNTTTRYSAYGDVLSCHINYVRLYPWQYILGHELMHCQGYMEGGWGITPWLINVTQNSYSDFQKGIMSDERVDHWYDTSYYAAQDDTWHDR